MTRNLVVFSLIFVALFASCNNSEGEKKQVNTTENHRDNLERVNKFLAEKDKDKIECFARRHKLNAKFDANGFWKATIESGNSKTVKDGVVVALVGSVSLLNGTLCYNYTDDKPLIFVVDKSEAISGLHHAMLSMTEGERAVLIFPPHLAHGILGDSNKIPPRSILVYDVKIVETK